MRSKNQSQLACRWVKSPKLGPNTCAAVRFMPRLLLVISTRTHNTRTHFFTCWQWQVKLTLWKNGISVDDGEETPTLRPINPGDPFFQAIARG